ncbi:MAG: hypothetical protein CVU54_14500 [Deltaproteobacteria bacterium HGW-Deltaproteobacteria-12]|nr:MAG: hypothetical protein CVU54_14500 [Deltaproteobacteria bacterium HGW-Deltaproteobacteria-12]
MKETSKKKEIIEKVIADLKSEKDGYCRITHKKGWLGFLGDGDLVITPYELQDVLKKVISNYPPRGKKLFCLRKKDTFTVTIEKTPYRPEEALERFITAANPENFYGQVPIGGGKESIDIGIQESGEKFIFVELKPWRSTNTPLYAIVESLKNLIEYRFILEKQIEDIPRFKEVDLIVLAPQSYYRDYGLIDSTGLPWEDKIDTVKKALNDLSLVFETSISLMILPIEKEDFLDKCRRICEEQNIDKQQSISISKSAALPELARNKWKLLVSSDKE